MNKVITHTHKERERERERIFVGSRAIIGKKQRVPKNKGKARKVEK